MLSLAEIEVKGPTSTRPSFHTLPPELVEFVFSFACYFDPSSFSPRTSPLRLGQVCRAWRSFVWPIPEFWGTIDLKLSTQVARYCAQVQLLEEWLERSQDYPLSIYMLSPASDDSHWAANPPHEVAKLLALHSWHWSSIDISIPRGCYDTFDPIQGNLPLLKSISLRHPSLRRIARRLRVFQDCPSLREVNLSTYYLVDIVLPWVQLTHCTTRTFYVHECYNVLAMCPKLTFAVFMDTVDTADGHFAEGRLVGRPQLILPNLMTLSLVRVTSEDTIQLLRCLNCPSMKQLLLDCLQTLPRPVPIDSTVRSWGCNLESLSISNVFSTGAELIRFLWDNPTVRHLALADPALTPFVPQDIMDAACASPDFLPRLERLELGGRVDSYMEDIERMMKDRWNQSLGSNGSRCAPPLITRSVAWKSV